MQAVEHDDKLRYAAATLTLLQTQMAIRKEFERDPNFETYEARFTEKMGKAQGVAG